MVLKRALSNFLPSSRTASLFNQCQICVLEISAVQKIMPQSSCVSLQVASGTGCAWMCDYCANQLGTNNYYFTDGVCTYESTGCQGNPMAGKTYTCCSSWVHIM